MVAKPLFPALDQRKDLTSAEVQDNPRLARPARVN